MRLTYELKQMALNVCGPHSISLRAEINKKAGTPERLALLQVTRNSSCPTAELGHQSLPTYGLGLKYSWVSNLPAFRPELYHWLSWVSSLLTADFGTRQPP